MTDEVDLLTDWLEDGDDDARVDVTEELVRKMRAITSVISCLAESHGIIKQNSSIITSLFPHHHANKTWKPTKHNLQHVNDTLLIGHCGKLIFRGRLGNTA